ncbi:LysR family transcriptional regulator [Ralstonia mannitolilytica]|uniref:HTH-type transcriptional regulator DmlR n=1 Tax=Ralstonia mannitolilytica TaxID=105219 RepID=A0AAD2AZ52_9RALS|nr:LysR family transcriptional regulator [Ralstonia mannitolilytica]ANA35039.1 LysR family transcriptional regulator [Ralstonia mannitolilytica]MBY4717127.1 LysR family transcriptional regulator [Ralstonia mannitolilytica]CAJ0684768.1 HTH-type transcriptional regulator DmlR [Ralstonia mannitolilytica]CAJ0689214.1 HTH-type transcriptional regulator DmlR [Ralstonia mannitolilytica]CAJ0696245.1 HTH-type transcriptional regulator DmlR [Ralstonia mannitolilytica]
MKRFDDLYLFTRVVEAGGFSAAERATGIPKSRLSRRIAELEAQLGTRLLHRSSHRVSVTPVGEAVYRHARDMADASAAIEALAGAARSEPAGVLRVGTSPLLAETLVAGWLAAFADAHPKLRVELDLSNTYVDLVEQRIDVAIRAATGPLPSREVVARHLAVSPRVLVASPALIARLGEPASPAALEDLPCLGQGTLARSRDWVLHDARGHRLALPVRPRFASDNIIALREAAIAGLGLAVLPLHCCHAALTEGRLRPVLPEWTPEPADLHALYPSRAGVPPSVKALVAFLRDRFQQETTMKPLAARVG